MQILNDENYKLRTPYTDEFNIDGMDDNSKNNYFRMYSLYMDLLTQYLIKNTPLKDYDNYLLNSELNFVSINDDRQDVYQKLCNDKLKYFYVRNNLYLSRLSKEEFEYLKRIYMTNDFGLNSITENFIQNTYKKVIAEEIGVENTLIHYGPVSPRFFAPIDALVIGFRYDDFNYNGMSDNEWDINYTKQKEFLYKNIPTLLNTMKTNLNNNNIALIKYDDFSVVNDIEDTPLNQNKI